MCFSATASFTASALLVSAGVYCAVKAIRSDKRYFLFAIIPVIFGIQQFTEGMVWIQLLAGNSLAVHQWALIYLFFAFAWWPFFMPLSLYFTEKKSSRRKIMALLTIAGLILGVTLYAPLILHTIPLTTSIINKSLYYSTYQSTAVKIVAITCYVFITISAILFSSSNKIKVFGILLFISLLMTIFFYFYNFVSVWCFFAAVPALYIVYIIHTLPKNPYQLNMTVSNKWRRL